MFPKLSWALSLIGPVALAACMGTLPGDDGGDDETPGADDPRDDLPPDEPPPPSPAVYQRGSLTPLFELLPRAEYGRLAQQGVPPSDADFQSPAVRATAAQKIDEIAAQLATERGLTTPVPLIARQEDRQRAQQIPFRGNPSDVDIVEVAGRRKAYVPLGGDLTTPGNEVAAVDLDAGTVTRIRVGLRPQRTAVHPSGLVFVCNQYSNYVSVIDPSVDRLLENGDGPVEIATEYHCADLVFAAENRNAPDPDRQILYVANGWRASVLAYGIVVDRDPLSNRPVDVRVVDPVAPSPANQPAREITGVGSNPFRLHLSEARRAIYVANNRGGEIARFDLDSGEVTRRIAVNAPSIDIVQIGSSVFVPTTMPDRGLLSAEQPAPNAVQAAPARVTGLDGQSHEAHPGALFDRTRSYNFEDIRNGLFRIDYLLDDPAPEYFTDDISAERNFQQGQKILAGALPWDIERNRAGDRLFVTMSGSDVVQELSVGAGNLAVDAVPGGIFETEERPFALALDEAAGQLLVVSWGGESLEIFDVANRQRERIIDLGYAQPAYPATNIERGEYFFYNADWSNNGRKSCASCHTDELLADGVGYANGATAPTAYHQVRPNYNLMTTDAYFWNGSFANGSYASLASAAQTRTNCELIVFGFIEGPASDPNERIGDPANRMTNDRDAECRPVPGSPGDLPANFDDIAPIIAEQKAVGDQVILAATGLSRAEVTRLTDFYSVAELRLPPNALRHHYQADELDSATRTKLERGAALFRDVGCATCHDPDNARHPYTDGLEHGSGATWRQQFVDTYFDDPRVLAVGGIPQQMLEAISPSTADPEINIHLDPIDYFTPFCFAADSCLSFLDPLAARGNAAEEGARLDRLIRINLADPDRGFVPGNVPGQPAVNTPSLRGVWWQSNILRHGHANSVNEAILAPGHPALREDEQGFAINAAGEIDVHGRTSQLTPEDIEALRIFLASIE